MTTMHYLAAPRELPTGAFGLRMSRIRLRDHLKANPAQREQPVIQILLEQDPEGEQWMDSYETELDAAGLYVAGPTNSLNLQSVFRQPFVYQIQAQGGSFTMNEEIREQYPEAYQTMHKCIGELFGYLDRNLQPGEEMELYCAVDSGWENPFSLPLPELDCIIDLSQFELGASFEWPERQYIRVIRTHSSS